MERRSEPAWRSGFQQKYLSRLIAELRRRRFERGGGGDSNVWSGVRAVKSAADVSLAMVARGRTAWSRAIIFARAGNRSLLRVSRRRRNHASKSIFHLHLHSLVRSAAARPLSAFSSKMSSVRRLRRSSPREEQSVQSRIKTLRTLVPGSRGLDTPLLLEEVADYIMALKMQVQSMQTLTSLLSNSSGCGASCPR